MGMTVTPRQQQNTQNSWTWLSHQGNNKSLTVKGREHASSCSGYDHLPTRPLEGNWINCSVIIHAIRWPYNQITSIQDPIQIFITDICLYQLVFSCFIISKQCKYIIFLKVQIKSPQVKKRGGKITVKKIIIINKSHPKIVNQIQLTIN